jgi:hypothetical protein
MRILRGASVGVAGAVAAGVVVGVVSRALMRVVTLAADHHGSFAWADSLGILVVYAVAMLPGGLAAAFTVRRYRWLVAAGGSILLLVPAFGIASDEIGETDGLSAVRWIALLASSGAVFATIVLLPFVTVSIIDRLQRPLREATHQSPEQGTGRLLEALGRAPGPPRDHH